MNTRPTASLTAETAISVVQGCLIVSLQGDLPGDALLRIRQDILDAVSTSDKKAVIIDFSAIHVLDTHAFSHLADSARMVTLIGAKTVWTGFRPGVVSFLVDMNVDAGNIPTFRTVEDGITYLTERLQSCQVTAEDDIVIDDEFVDGDDD